VSISTLRIQGTAFRAHNPRWSHAPASGEGAQRHGGRFNPPGVAALYLSQDAMTALLEAQQGFPFKPQPMLLCAYEVDCGDMADLADPAVRRAAGVTEGELACPWEAMRLRSLTPPTWALARRLIEDGVASIRVRSFAPGAEAHHLNLVFWQWQETPPHRVRVIDDDGRLPRDDRSWR